MLSKLARNQSRIAVALRSIENTKIYSRHADITAFLDEVQKHADKEKHALGFWPGQVYKDAAREGRLLIAVEEDGKSKRYAGHLLFSRTFPKAKILQLYVSAKYRSRGIARRLVESLTASLEMHNYLSIYARVADDLPANVAWERLGFSLVCQKPGGVTTQRTINVRVKPLRTPTLFGPQESLPDTELQLATSAAIGPPSYAIDLNVFFDVVRHRPRAKDAAKVISAGLANLVRIVVAEEFVTELRRTSKSGTSDPVLEFASELPTIPSPPSEILARLTGEVQSIAFPNRAHSLRVQDRSDLIHLATAIHHTLTGFVTNELAFLRERHQFYQRYNLKVMDVSQFADAVKTSQEPVKGMETRVSGSALSIREITNDNEDDLEKFLRQFILPEGFRAHFRSQPVATKKRLVVASGSDIICATAWDCVSGLHPIADARLVANEEHAALETALDVLLDRICRETSKKGETFLRLEIPAGQVTSHAIAGSKGFTRPANDKSVSEILCKACLGRTIEAKDWPATAAWLRNMTGIELQTFLPDFAGDHQTISFGAAGRQGKISLGTLETLLGPTLLLMNGRPGVIVPIRRSFADALLGSASQFSLLPSPKAVLLSERVYYSSNRNARLFRKGLPLIFYESGKEHGRSSAVALCRIRETVVASKAAISGQLLRHGVLDEAEIEHLTTEDRISVITFDTLMLFQSPISLRRLREIGCINEANLVGPVRLAPEHLMSIVREGRPSA